MIRNPSPSIDSEAGRGPTLERDLVGRALRRVSAVARRQVTESRSARRLGGIRQRQPDARVMLLYPQRPSAFYWATPNRPPESVTAPSPPPAARFRPSAFRLRTCGHLSNLTQRCLPEGIRSSSLRRPCCEPRDCRSEWTPARTLLQNLASSLWLGTQSGCLNSVRNHETAEQTQLSRLCVSIRGKLQFMDYLVRAAWPTPTATRPKPTLARGSSSGSSSRCTPPI